MLGSCSVHFHRASLMRFLGLFVYMMPTMLFVFRWTFLVITDIYHVAWGNAQMLQDSGEQAIRLGYPKMTDSGEEVICPSMPKSWTVLCYASCGSSVMTTIFLPISLIIDNKSNVPHLSSSDAIWLASYDSRSSNINWSSCDKKKWVRTEANLSLR